MATERINFTVDNLKKLKPPESGRKYVYDTRVPGLAVCVTANGTRTFYRIGRINGRPERVKIGRFPELSVEQARKACNRLHGQVAEGKNPQDQRRATAVKTVSDLYECFMEHARAHKRRFNQDEKYYRVYIQPRWGNRLLRTIRRSHVADLHAAIGKAHGHVTANRTAERLRAWFNHAIENERYTGANPCTGFKRFPETSRERFLDAGELARWFAAVEQEPSELMRDFFRLLLFTAARKGNLRAARWEQVSFDRAVWTIPPENAKAGKPIVVPLVDAALEILQRRHQDAANGCPWVFPSPSKLGYLQEPKHAWAATCKRAGLSGVTMHDLRRTAASWQVLTGASLQVIGKSLGHQSLASTQVYARLTDESVIREASQRATDAMLEAANGGVENGD